MDDSLHIYRHQAGYARLNFSITKGVAEIYDNVKLIPKRNSQEEETITNQDFDTNETLLSTKSPIKSRHYSSGALSSCCNDEEVIVTSPPLELNSTLSNESTVYPTPPFFPFCKIIFLRQPCNFNSSPIVHQRQRSLSEPTHWNWT